MLAIPSTTTSARPALLESTSNSFENGDISEQRIAVPRINGDEQQSPNKGQRINDGGASYYQGQSLAYWPDSPEANQLFQPRKNVSSRDCDSSLMFSEESLQEAVQRRIKLLQSVHEFEDGR